MSNGKFDPPLYMERGSKGPVVDKVLTFLDRWANENDLGPTDIKTDGLYGKVGFIWAQAFQREMGIDDDGGFGPQTREAAFKYDDFDFVKEAKDTGDELTAFVQPDGQVLYWGLCIVATPDKEVALSNLRRIHHGD